MCSFRCADQSLEDEQTDQQNRQIATLANQIIAAMPERIKLSPGRVTDVSPPFNAAPPNPQTDVSRDAHLSATGVTTVNCFASGFSCGSDASAAARTTRSARRRVRATTCCRRRRSPRTSPTTRASRRRCTSSASTTTASRPTSTRPPRAPVRRPPVCRVRTSTRSTSTRPRPPLQSSTSTSTRRRRSWRRTSRN